MANLALHLDVLAGEREIGLVVVKLGRLFPVALVVALGAVGAQGFLVLVVLLVAVIAAGGELVFVDPTGGVASIALGALVLAQQVVLGVTVVVEGDAPSTDANSGKQTHVNNGHKRVDTSLKTFLGSLAHVVQYCAVHRLPFYHATT